MAHLRKRTTIVPIAFGFAFLPLAKVPSAFGDLASLQGDSATALQYHLAALLLLLVGLACFGVALVNVVRHLRGKDDERPIAVRPSAASPAAEPSFDPDAIMARYLASRDAAAPPPPRSFGRKGR